MDTDLKRASGSVETLVTSKEQRMARRRSEARRHIRRVRATAAPLPSNYTEASEVTITDASGESRRQPALSPEELRQRAAEDRERRKAENTYVGDE